MEKSSNHHQHDDDPFWYCQDTMNSTIKQVHNVRWQENKCIIAIALARDPKQCAGLEVTVPDTSNSRYGTVQMRLGMISTAASGPSIEI